MTQNNNKEVQYIWHNGVRIREDQLISMAKHADNYEEAKCYIISIMAHGLIYGIYNYINKVNEIRVHHNVAPLPLPEVNHVPTNNAGRRDLSDDTARKLYMMMDMSERLQVISLSLTTFYENHPDLFRSKNDWIGIYLVIRDRVNGNLSMTDFYNSAQKLMAKCWPEHLMIGRYTMGNFSRCIDYEDRQGQTGEEFTLWRVEGYICPR